MFLFSQELLSHSFMLSSAGKATKTSIFWHLKNCYSRRVFARIWGLVPSSALWRQEDAKLQVDMGISCPLCLWTVVVLGVWSKKGLQIDTALKQSYKCSKGTTTVWMVGTIPKLRSSIKQFVQSKNSIYLQKS